MKSYLKLMKMILFLIVYAHCFSCAWWFIIKVDRIWIPPIDMNKIASNYYIIYKAEFSTQYLYSLQISIWTIIGGDIMPRNTVQTILVSIGLFLGALINANIFGELALILSDMNRKLKIFELKMARTNTVMIDLHLPFELQQYIRKDLTIKDPSH